MAEEFNFIETNTEEIYTLFMNWLLEKVDEPLYPADERRIFGETLVFVMTNVFSLFNDNAKQRTLQYARGAVLDAIGERVGATRLQPSAAYDTFRFYVSEVLNQNIVIPAGTRITQDGAVYYATESAAVIQAGSMFVDVLAVCTTAGAAYNGTAAGTIKTLVDLIPYVARVENLNGTTGGDDGEPYTTEGDDRFRERIKLAPATFSAAGTLERYRYFALSADPDILDVHVTSPEATQVVFYPLMKGGTLPDEETIAKVLAAVSKDDVRSMTDLVTVKAPEQVEYDIQIKYYCTLDNEADAITIVESAGGAIDQYKEWQCEKMGRDINPEELRRFMYAPPSGIRAVDRAEIISPVFTKLADGQIAKFSGNLIVSHEVTE